MPAEINSLLIALAVALLSYVISYINNKKLCSQTKMNIMLNVPIARRRYVFLK